MGQVKAVSCKGSLLNIEKTPRDFLLPYHLVPTADSAEDRPRLDRGGPHPRPDPAHGGSAHEQDRAFPFLILLGLPDCEAARAVRFEL